MGMREEAVGRRVTTPASKKVSKSMETEHCKCCQNAVCPECKRPLNQTPQPTYLPYWPYWSVPPSMWPKDYQPVIITSGNTYPMVANPMAANS